MTKMCNLFLSGFYFMFELTFAKNDLNYVLQGIKLQIIKNWDRVTFFQITPNSSGFSAKLFSSLWGVLLTTRWLPALTAVLTPLDAKTSVRVWMPGSVFAWAGTHCGGPVPAPADGAFEPAAPLRGLFCFSPLLLFLQLFHSSSVISALETFGKSRLEKWWREGSENNEQPLLKSSLFLASNCVFCMVTKYILSQNFGFCSSSFNEKNPQTLQHRSRRWLQQNTLHALP